MLRLVIFDFDGVIADTERAHFATFMAVLAELGVSISWQQYCEKYLGYTDYEGLLHILRDFGRPVEPDMLNRLCLAKKEKFAEHIRSNSVILPGIAEFVGLLRENGLICSICSGALRSEIDSILAKSEFGRHFPVIVSAENVKLGKPSPEGFELALSLTNSELSLEPPIKSGQCLVIEDSLWGIAAAKSAGMKVLAVQTTYGPAQLKSADKVVSGLKSCNISVLTSIFD